MEKGTHSNSHRVQKKEEGQSRPRGLGRKQFPLAQPLLPDGALELAGVGGGVALGRSGGRLGPEALLGPLRASAHQAFPLS